LQLPVEKKGEDWPASNESVICRTSWRARVAFRDHRAVGCALPAADRLRDQLARQTLTFNPYLANVENIIIIIIIIIIFINTAIGWLPGGSGVYHIPYTIHHMVSS